MNPSAHLHNLRMIDGRFQHAGGHIGDAAEAQHPQAAVPGDDGFRHGGHAHGVGSQHTGHADFRGSFIAGAVHPAVHAPAQINIQLAGHLHGNFPQAPVKGVGHIREAGAEGVQIGPGEGILAGEIDKMAKEERARTAFLKENHNLADMLAATASQKMDDTCINGGI